MHTDCWIQQVTTRVGAVTCWIQQSASPKQLVGFICVSNSEIYQLIRKFTVCRWRFCDRNPRGFGRSDKRVHLQGGQDNFYVAWVFALELKLSKTLSGLVYFVPYLYGGPSPPYICNTTYTSPLRVFDNFNSKAKILATFNFCKN